MTTNPATRPAIAPLESLSGESWDWRELFGDSVGVSRFTVWKVEYDSVLWIDEGIAEGEVWARAVRRAEKEGRVGEGLEG